MKTIKEGYTGSEVDTLCKFIDAYCRSTFDSDLKNRVINFQKESGLDADGIVGPNTWLKLIINYRNRTVTSSNIQDTDYTLASMYLDCESAAVKAVVKVETGGKGGFLSSGRPTILFEGHIFWKQLKNIGIDPNKYSKSYPDIVYSKWDKSKYKGGEKEYDRLSKAEKINKNAALCSISMGMFQIMGFNYQTCGCKTVDEMWNGMCKSEFMQMIYGMEFIRKSGAAVYLQKKDWKGFARSYNGPEYYKNKYDSKLEIAYKSYL